MRNNYYISVVLPTYNRADLISDTIDSVLAQTYKNYEIIIVDDGSTDNTSEVVSKYQKTNENIVYKKLNHLGVCSARNEAIKISTGDYLFFLDSDDCIHPLLFERMIEAIKETGAKMSSEMFCATKSRDMRKIIENPPDAISKESFIYRNHEETVYDIFHNSPICMIGGLLVEKSITENVLFDTRFIIGEDKLYTYQCINNNADYVIIPEKWYYNRRDNAKASRNHSRTAFLSRYMRRKIVWLSEFDLDRQENAILQICEGFGFALTHFRRYKSIKEFAFLSHVIRNDRKYMMLLPNYKFRILVFFVSNLNPFLLLERNAKELDMWKKTGLY